MMNKTLNESQLKERILEIYKEEYITVLEEKWNKLSKNDKIVVVEMLKVIYPEKAKLVKESKWYNTLGDIVGVFDPTGVVDLVNGVSYWRQGDKLFAVLSWVSVIPLLGDVIAKPVVGVLKTGGAATKAFRTAVVAGDAVKIAETAKLAGGPVAKMVEKAPSWGGKLLEVLKTAVGKIPGIGAPLIRSVEEFVGIFSKASREIKMPAEVIKGGKVINVEKGLTSLEKEQLMKYLEKEQGKMFRGHKDVGNSWLKYMKSDATLGQKLSAGVPRIFGGNPATRSLMRRTKTYLGFLDWLGLANFVGPDELLQQVPNAEEKWDDYSQTEKAQQTWSEEMGGSVPPPPPSESGLGDMARQGIANKAGGDVFSSLVGSLLGK
jgi:hypothetical protein